MPSVLPQAEQCQQADMERNITKLQPLAEQCHKTDMERNIMKGQPQAEQFQQNRHGKKHHEGTTTGRAVSAKQTQKETS